MTNDDPTIDISELKKKEFKDRPRWETNLLSQSMRMAQYRDTNPHQYASSIETFMLLCPSDISEKSFKELERLGLKHGEYDSMTTDKIIKYDELWKYINSLLEKEGITWRKSSYEIGIED